MKMPEALKDYLDEKSLKRFASGAVFGLALVGFLGFGWMNAPNIGFKTSGAAAQMAAKGLADGKRSILAIDCVKAVKALPDVAAMKVKFAEAKDAWDFGRAFEGVGAQKLVTMPGESYPDNDLAKACGTAFSALAKTAAK